MKVFWCLTVLLITVWGEEDDILEEFEKDASGYPQELKEFVDEVDKKKALFRQIRSVYSRLEGRSGKEKEGLGNEVFPFFYNNNGFKSLDENKVPSGDSQVFPDLIRFSQQAFQATPMSVLENKKREIDIDCDKDLSLKQADDDSYLRYLSGLELVRGSEDYDDATMVWKNEIKRASDYRTRSLKATKIHPAIFKTKHKPKPKPYMDPIEKTSRLLLEDFHNFIRNQKNLKRRFGDAFVPRPNCSSLRMKVDKTGEQLNVLLEKMVDLTQMTLNMKAGAGAQTCDPLSKPLKKFLQHLLSNKKANISGMTRVMFMRDKGGVYQESFIFGDMDAFELCRKIDTIEIEALLRRYEKLPEECQCIAAPLKAFLANQLNMLEQIRGHCRPKQKKPKFTCPTTCQTTQCSTLCTETVSAFSCKKMNNPKSNYLRDQANRRNKFVKHGRSYMKVTERNFQPQLDFNA